MPTRTDWVTTWMRVAGDVSQRSKCSRRQIGAVIVSAENFNTWVGYNGPPAGWVPQFVPLMSTCESWCERAKLMAGQPTYDNCITIHAEANALLKSDPVLRKGGTIYVTSFPCWDCAKMIANSGIMKVVTNLDPMADAHRLPTRTIQMLTDSGLEVVVNGRVHG